MERLRSAGTWEKTLVLLLSTLGVYVTFLTNGVLHERMATERYGEEKEVLPDLTIVTTAMSVGSAVVAALLLALWGSLNSKDPKVRGSGRIQL